MYGKMIQGFLQSTAGQIVTVIVILAIFLSILISGKGKKTETKTLVVCALLTALAVALGAITLFKMPQGGSVTPFSILPIALAAYFYGVRPAVMVGICVGLLNLLINPYVIHPIQLLLDYPLAFGAVGLGGLFRNLKGFSIQTTFLFGILCRYLCAVVSGVIFFASYAPEGFPALLWSLWYNLTYLGVEAVMTVILLSVPVVNVNFQRLKIKEV